MAIDVFAIATVFIAAIGYGSYYVPVKKFEIYDGVVYQWFMCGGVLIAGIVGSCIRNDWKAAGMESTGFYVGREGLLSGAVWMVANVLATICVKYVGIGNYYLLHEITNLGGTFFIGVFGPRVGIPATTPSDVWLASLGFVFVLVGMVPIVFMKPDNVPTQHADAETLERPQADPAGDAHADLLPSAEDLNGRSFGDTLPLIPEKASQTIAVGARKKWLVGAPLSLFVGCILSCQYVPMLPWKQRLKDDGFIVQGFDYVLSTCLGIFLSSTAYLLLVGSWRRITREKMMKPVLRPALFAGVIWGVSCYCQLYAMSALPYAIAYCLVVGGGLAVSLSWGICAFGEAASVHNRKCVTLTFLGVIIGMVLLALAV